jgi:hypothetical protein
VPDPLLVSFNFCSGITFILCVIKIDHLVQKLIESHKQSYMRGSHVKIVAIYSEQTTSA